jgi:hypothetical protein
MLRMHKKTRNIQLLSHYVENAQENKKNTIVAYNRQRINKMMKRVDVFGC